MPGDWGLENPASDSDVSFGIGVMPAKAGIQ